MSLIRCVLLTCLSALGVMTANADCVSLDFPPHDAVVPISGATTILRGRTQASGRVNVRVQSNPVRNFFADIVDGSWQQEVDIDLETPTIIAIHAPTCAPLRVVITPVRAGDVFNQGETKYQLLWLDGADPALVQIGAETLTPDPDPVAFRQQVRARALAVARQYLSDFNIRLGPEPATNRVRVRPDRHPIDWYAETLPPEDCGDRKQDALIEVYLGSLRQDIRDYPTNWAVLKEDDGMTRRADDLGHALGTIIAHEILHANGLLQCSWMHGDTDSHNNPDFVLGTAQRFGNGTHIMDSFVYVLPPMLIGRDDTQNVPREYLKHDAFARSYLSAIHPRP